MDDRGPVSTSGVDWSAPSIPELMEYAPEIGREIVPQRADKREALRGRIEEIVAAEGAPSLLGGGSLRAPGWASFHG
jgi:hypothetical protein